MTENIVLQCLLRDANKRFWQIIVFPNVWVFLRVQSWYNWLSQQQSNLLCLFTYSQLLSIFISRDAKHYHPAGAKFAPECIGIIKCKRGYVDGWVTVNLGRFKTSTICMFALKVSYTSQQHIALWHVYPDVNSKNGLNPFLFCSLKSWCSESYD